MKAADGLDLPERKRISRVGILQVEIVGAPGLGVAVLIAIGADCEQCVGLVVHEVAAHLVGAVGEAIRMLVVGGCEKNDCGVDSAGTDGEKIRCVDGRIALVGCRRGILFDGLEREPVR